MPLALMGVPPFTRGTRDKAVFYMRLPRRCAPRNDRKGVILWAG